MAQRGVQIRVILIITICYIISNAFVPGFRAISQKTHHLSNSKCQRNSMYMMVPGQYRFVLKSPADKQSSIPLDASSSRTDLIQAEGSGSPCRIKVIGVGGGGGNAVNRMIESSTGVAGVELWVVNTDAQALSRSMAPRKLNIGSMTSR